jgi:glyoxylase-like metal-dependent hydrolase (beta-lactamase superfamily II)
MTSAANNDSARPSAAPAVTAEGETFSSPPRRLHYVEQPAPAPGTSVAVAAGVRWARIPLPMDLSHINVWLIEVDDGWIIVDTGVAISMGREAWETIEREVFATAPVRAVFITHIHPDHVGLAAWLQQRHGVPVLMSRRTHQLLDAMLGGAGAPSAADAQAFLRSHGLNDMERVASMLNPDRFRQIVSGMPEAPQHVGDSQTLRWGAQEWRALETNGHAEGHLCLSNERSHVLISGDQVLPTISSNISFNFRNADPNPLESYLDSLERLRTLPEDTLVLPSHGTPFRGLQHRIDDLRGHHEEQLEKLLGLCAQPMIAMELLPRMFRRELKGMHLFLALGETLAHLECLVQAGRMQRRPGEGVVRYVTA